MDAVEFFADKDDGNLFFEMGCVTGDTLVTISRNGASRLMTIADAYIKVPKMRTLTGDIPEIKTRSYLGDRIGLHPIQGIKYSGVKKVFQMVLANGMQIKLTPDHEVMTVQGYFPSCELQTGSLVMVDGHRETAYSNSSEITYSEVVSMVYVGEMDTYDMICQDPHRNYVANGIVIHNCGKTGTAILTYRNWCNIAQKRMRALVICPSVVLHNWKDEFGLFSKIEPSSITVLAKGSGNDKALSVRSKVDDPHSLILTVNYEALLNDNLFNAIEEWRPEVIIYDEIHLAKNPDTKRSKKCMRLGEFATKRLGLTGTPILNSVMDIFGVFRTIDKGDTFGINKYTFQNRYLLDMNASWKGRGSSYFPKWVNNPKTFEELNEKIYRKSLRKLKTECLDLPPLVKIKLLCEMGTQQAKVYNNLAKDFVAFISDNKSKGIDNSITANLAITKGLRLLQIATGFVVNDAGETIEFDKVPRLDRTKELLEQIVIDSNSKCILWCSYKQNYKMMKRICEELKIKYVMITGEENTSQKRESELAFQNDPEVMVVIANRKAGGVGVNLTAGSYSIVYSRNFSLDEQLQSEARNHRGGSEVHDKITKYDLACENTLDEQVLIALDGKEKISTSILDMVVV